MIIIGDIIRALLQALLLIIPIIGYRITEKKKYSILTSITRLEIEIRRMQEMIFKIRTEIEGEGDKKKPAE